MEAAADRYLGIYYKLLVNTMIQMVAWSNIFIIDNNDNDFDNDGNDDDCDNK